MPAESTYWLIETQSEGVRRFHGSAHESALEQACKYASSAPAPILHIEERRSGDEPDDRPFGGSTGWNSKRSAASSGIETLPLRWSA